MGKTIHWGILGAGRIARKFASSLRELPEASLAAVGSRSLERAQALAAEFGVQRSYGDYESLVCDPQVRVIYVATRHPDHLEAMRLCLEAGKAVLCEKPFTINAREAQQVVRLARQNRLFVMEAMWTRFFPVMRQVQSMIADGRIGEPRLLQADFGFMNDWNPDGRHLNLALGGGALLDVGVYVVSLSSALFGPPVSIASQADIGQTGVDETCGMVFRHAQGQISCLAAAIRTETRREAIIYGTEGRVEIHAPLWKPNAVTLFPSKGEPEHLSIPYPNFGYQFEAAHVMDCLEEGSTESPVMPLNETVQIMRTLDAVRAPWGLQYPGDLTPPPVVSP
jgi:dihydrodiol dehydrogenase / D-xylose 1-dehydrogenase (NADP)